MLLSGSGDMQGSVGGGALEANVLRLMTQSLAHGRSVVQRFVLSRAEAVKEGMICGGETEVLVEKIDPTPENLSLYSFVHKELTQGRNVRLATWVEEGRSKRMLDLGPGTIPDSVAGAFPPSGAVSMVHDAPRTWILENISCRRNCLIFGAGHVGRCVALLADRVDFAVTVLDDRVEFADPGAYPPGIDVCLLPGFNEWLAVQPVDPATFILIMTRGHAHDGEVLVQALGTPAAYIGMIGSIRKRDTLFTTLRKAGHTEENLLRVHCPVGLAIGADTPEEIAVSVVAEMIQVRARQAERLNE
jgi:xanthine dehydrogenase accessory factor